MSTNPVVNMLKGAALGLAAGVAVGVAGKKAIDENPKLRKKANRAYRAFETVVDAAQYMLK